LGPLQFVFLACISAMPERCVEVPGPIFGEPVTQSICMLEGPAITDAWMRRNPGWMVREWACRPPGRLDA
jgi:hypothetical protein